jgi:hypothetical protein
MYTYEDMRHHHAHCLRSTLSRMEYHTYDTRTVKEMPTYVRIQDFRCPLHAALT